MKYNKLSFFIGLIFCCGTIAIQAMEKKYRSPKLYEGDKAFIPSKSRIVIVQHQDDEIVNDVTHSIYQWISKNDIEAFRNFYTKDKDKIPLIQWKYKLMGITLMEYAQKKRNHLFLEELQLLKRFPERRPIIH